MGKVKRFILLPLLLLVSWVSPAQKVAFEIVVPEVVAVGEVFRVEFVSDTRPKNFVEPTFGGMDILAGPSFSSSKNVSIVNGNLEQTNQFSYTYVLQCNSEGEFTISAAGIEVGKDTYNTRPHTVKAITESGRPAEASGAGNQNAVVAPDDILLMASVDKSRVFKGEPVRVSFKLYSRPNIGGLHALKIPSFNGFWTQQLNVANTSLQRETYNDKIYEVRVVAEYLVFPQMAGSLTIDAMELEAIAHIITRQQRQSIFDDFFGGPNIQEVRRRISSAPIRITVNELPSGAPDSFSGAVGEFEMTSSLPSSEIAANTAVTYTVKISGNGNLPQVQAPKLNIPSSFEQYNIKTTETLNNSRHGIVGYRQFEYPVIARVAGDYDIRPIEFTYFNPRLAKYVTLATPPLNVKVVPDSTSVRGGGGMISGLSKEDIKILGRDIRFIKLGSVNLHPKGRLLMGSPLYFVLLALIVGVFAFLLVWLRKMLEERRNSALIKGKKANKVALLRFRAAERYMKEDNQRGFYEEMLKALWGYMSDKLNIPVANLTKENIREELIKRGIHPDQASRYVEIIGECEYAQYAPAASGRMNDAYAAGVEIISKFESIIGK